jgi:hypothetical protein
MSLFSLFARLSTATRPYNIVVTNVPGPTFPTYLLGAKMQAVYPLVPLNRNQALGIALFSYDGGLYWGFNADWDAVPDLHDLVGYVDRELSDLFRAASAAPVPIGSLPPPKKQRRRAGGRPRGAGARVAHNLNPPVPGNSRTASSPRKRLAEKSPSVPRGGRGR